MKRIMTLVLAAGLVFGVATHASAIDFNAKGQWIMGFGAVDSTFVTENNNKKTNADDKFAALQRVRLQMDAVASEALSGTVFFEIGDQTWGKAGKSGAALGTDGINIEVRRAYIDWTLPNSDLKFRMGLQGLTLPNAAGGSAIFDDDVAAITATYRFNDMVSLTAVWARPFNDNFGGVKDGDPAGFLDNADYFGFLLPITGDGWTVTPWIIGGYWGNNTGAYPAGLANAAKPTDGFASAADNMPPAKGESGYRYKHSAYTGMFFAGLPITITALDPWNFELDLNYGYSEGMGMYDAQNSRTPAVKRANQLRRGWLAKGLIEYKMDWGTPGIFGWYGSGDDGDIKNGSERMPVISPCGNFTSFMGDGDINGWSIWSGSNLGYDIMYAYQGTWGVGLQITDMSFLEGLKHNVRVAYWGGTNQPSMVKYLTPTYATAGVGTDLYLTTHDHLIEFNVDSTYQIYENLTATLELGYIINGIDKGTWERAFFANKEFEKGDAYKAALIFNYSF